jgi:predicted transcriptional regulator of viral defense system
LCYERTGTEVTEGGGGYANGVVAGLAALFREDNWAVTTQQLRAAGFSPGQIGRLTRRGVLTSPRRGIYVPGTVAESASVDEARTEARRVAAALAGSDLGLVASHRSAAIMHRLDLLTVSSGRVITATQPRRGAGSRSGYPGIHVHTAELPADHVTTQFGVRCTTVARTVIDLARSGSFDAGVVVADNALHANKTTRTELQAVLARCTRWPGMSTARRAVQFCDERSESVLESIARVAMHEHGLEPPELQVWVGGDGMRIGRVDFLWRQYRTIAEADGKKKYNDPREATWQLERDSRLRDAGFEVIHFTWADIVYSPEVVMTRIQAAFERSSRLGLN